MQNPPSILADLVSRPDRPAAMAPFDRAARQIVDRAWPEALATDGRPIVAVVCNLAPLELARAAGAVAVRLCAGAVEPTLCMAATPRDMCQVCKGSLARLEALQGQTGRTPAAVIVPATCDWKSHAARFYGPADVVRVLDVPRDPSLPRARRGWRRQIAELADFLGQRAGRPIRRRALLDSVLIYQRAAWLGRGLADVMKQPQPPVAGADLMLVFNLFYSLPVEVWIDAATELLRELSARPPLERQPSSGWRPRLLLVGAPLIWPNFALPLLVDSLGGQIVADSLCSGHRGFSDLVSIDETNRSALIAALADRYLLPCTCPCFTSNEEYFRRLENLVGDFRIDGAILHRLKNCYLFDMQAAGHQALFDRLGVPLLQIEEDYESAALGAATTRIEAFLDLVRQKGGPSAS